MDAPAEPGPAHRLAGGLALLLVIVIVATVYFQFRGDFLPKAPVTLMADRAGLSMDSGARVTYNGVRVGRVATITPVTDATGRPRAQMTLDLDPKYLHAIPANVRATISAGTIFGNKSISLSSPPQPAQQRIVAGAVITADNVTTELNTVFQTVVELSQHVDPIKLNQTLAATAQASDGLGTRFGESISNGNDILAQLNPLMPEIHADTAALADAADIYANAAPDLLDALANATVTARTLNGQQHELDSALMAAVGFGTVGADTFEKAGPYFIRGNSDLLSTSALLDEYSPEFFCMIRNYRDVVIKGADAGGGNGYSVRGISELVGAGNPYVYPDNLPRINAHGGPEGRPGCWQPITRDLFPAPYLVMDTGASIAPYNHFALGQPILTDYIWGRQVGEYTINP